MSRWWYCRKYTKVGTLVTLRFFAVPVFPISLKIDGKMREFTKLASVLTQALGFDFIGRLYLAYSPCGWAIIFVFVLLFFFFFFCFVLFFVLFRNGKREDRWEGKLREHAWSIKPFSSHRTRNHHKFKCFQVKL